MQRLDDGVRLAEKEALSTCRTPRTRAVRSPVWQLQHVLQARVLAPQLFELVAPPTTVPAVVVQQQQVQRRVPRRFWQQRWQKRRQQQKQ
jgi:hypothetical protein